MPNDRLCRWAGWGAETDRLVLDDRPDLKAYISQRLGGLHEPPEKPVPVESISAPASRLPEPAVAELLRALAPDCLLTDSRDRLIHSVGRSYRDMIHARTGAVNPVTDAVVYPRNESDVAEVLSIARRHGIAVVPFGGGTSVVGGVEPRTGPLPAVITLDTLNLDRISIDAHSLLAEIGAGAFGPDIERTLNAAGFTLGHFPQSFEFSALGGWIAARGAGQQSTRYGKIEEMVQAVRLATPAGLVETRNVPASASGPGILQYIIGSEGTLGVITSATLRIRPLPEKAQYAVFLLPTFEAGCELLRQVRQAELPVSVVRLSDPEETRWLTKASADHPSLSSRIGKSVVRGLMRHRRFDLLQTCIAILSMEGKPHTVARSITEAKRIAAGLNAVPVGASPGRKWEHDRFRLPYLRDELLARRVMVDTLETATTWTNLQALYMAVCVAINQAMQQAGPPGAVMCHLSHVYPSGSSLYFTFLTRQAPGREIEQWETVKKAATAAIIANGGTLSHHHGIGYEHRPLAAEHGSTAVAALAAAKVAVDPTGIMNPGKVLDG